MKKLVLLLIFAATSAFAQVSSNTWIFSSTAPSGSCSAGAPGVLTLVPGTLYTCQNGTYAQVSGGGGGGDSVTSPNGTIAVGGTATATTVDVANALTLNNSGTGAASGSTYNGSAPVTASYNTLGAAGLAAANTFTAGNVFNGAGTSTSPGLLINGTQAAGSSTTPCQLYISQSGNTNPTFPNGGCLLGINAPTGFAGNQIVAGCINGGTCGFTVSGTGALTTRGFNTVGNCAANGTAASPSVVSCGSSPVGVFSCSTTASGATCTVNTTAITANSDVVVQMNAAAGTRLGVTCNTAPTNIPASGFWTSVVAGTSFTITMPTISTNPACFTYFIVD